MNEDSELEELFRRTTPRVPACDPEGLWSAARIERTLARRLAAKRRWPLAAGAALLLLAVAGGWTTARWAAAGELAAARAAGVAEREALRDELYTVLARSLEEATEQIESRALASTREALKSVALLLRDDYRDGLGRLERRVGSLTRALAAGRGSLAWHRPAPGAE